MFGYPQYPQQYPQFAQYPQPDYLDQLNRLKQQQAPPQQMQQQSNPDERIWVQGQGAAEAYLVAPNSFVRLWDSQAPIFYEKRADQTGRPFLEVFEYKRKGTDSPTAELSQSSQLSSNTSYYSYSSEPDSEFKEIARNADFEHLLRVLDEHMKAIEAMYPREYRSVLRKIKEGT